MTKKQPAMQVCIDITEPQLRHIADYFIDDLYDKFGHEVVDAVGIVEKDLKSEIIEFQPFLEMVRDSVSRYGVEAIEFPYDFMDYSQVQESEEWKKLLQTCELMNSIIREIDKEIDLDKNRNIQIENAKKVMKANGYKIICPDMQST